MNGAEVVGLVVGAATVTGMLSTALVQIFSRRSLQEDLKAIQATQQATVTQLAVLQSEHKSLQEQMKEHNRHEIEMIDAMIEYRGRE